MDDGRRMEDFADRIARAYYHRVYRYIRRRSNTAEQAEDITQDVFERALEHAEDLRTANQSPLAWLHVVARNRLIDEARRRRRHAQRDVPHSPETDVVHSPNHGPAFVAALRAAIESLPAAQRRVVVLKLLAGKSFAEIAASEGITVSACKMRFIRGLEQVRCELEKRGVTP